MKKLYLLNSENAHMPELSAYPAVLSRLFEVKRVDDYFGDYADGMFWCFMGLYHRRNNAAFLVHDYRSLSTGTAGRLKDLIKKYRNPKPDLRVFLNESIESVMGFDDGIPSFCLDMGIPDSLLSYESDQQRNFRYRFGYIGEISKDRGLDKVLEAFCSSSYRKEDFVLIGRVEPGIEKEFNEFPNIHFLGTLPQEEVFRKLETVEFAVAPLPNRRPYIYQTATKLLEYAALGKKIIANRNPSMEKTASKYGIHCTWTEENIFSSYFDLDMASDNAEFDASTLSWDGLIERSGLMDFLSKVELS